MTKINVTNFTMNSNLSVYLGAYANQIRHLAILVSDINQSILSVIPYLKQMCIDYKIYADEMSFFKDSMFFHPDTLLLDSNAFDLNTFLNIPTIDTEVDIIATNPSHSLSDKLSEKEWYWVTIYNPRTKQKIDILHSNASKNKALLMKLNNYQTISVE